MNGSLASLRPAGISVAIQKIASVALGFFLAFAGCSVVREQKLEVSDNASWLKVCGASKYFYEAECHAETELPETDISLYPEEHSDTFYTGKLGGPYGTALVLVFTPAEHGLLFEPYKVRLDGQPPDEVSFPGSVVSASLKRVDPAAPVSLDTTQEFKFNFSFLDARKVVKVAVNGLSKEGRAIKVPTVDIQQSWASHSETALLPRFLAR